MDHAGRPCCPRTPGRRRCAARSAVDDGAAGAHGRRGHLRDRHLALHAREVVCARPDADREGAYGRRATPPRARRRPVRRRNAHRPRAPRSLAGCRRRRLRANRARRRPGRQPPAPDRDGDRDLARRSRRARHAELLLALRTAPSRRRLHRRREPALQRAGDRPRAAPSARGEDGVRPRGLAGRSRVQAGWATRAGVPPGRRRPYGVVGARRGHRRDRRRRRFDGTRGGARARRTGGRPHPGARPGGADAHARAVARARRAAPAPAHVRPRSRLRRRPTRRRERASPPEPAAATR